MVRTGRRQSNRRDERCTADRSLAIRGMSTLYVGINGSALAYVKPIVTSQRTWMVRGAETSVLQDVHQDLLIRASEQFQGEAESSPHSPEGFSMRKTSGVGGGKGVVMS
jgi:hypothetical protein